MHDALKSLEYIYINLHQTRKSECVWSKFYVKVHHNIANVSIFGEIPAIG